MQKYVLKHSHSKSGRVDNSELAEESEDGMIPAAKDRTMPQMSRSTEKPRENVRKFLNEIPKLPSHYCRASSSKLYLEPHFSSLADVYKLFTETQTANVASRQVFADEFNKMNIALFMPKKDQCDKCCAFKTGNLSEADHQEHVERKEEARRMPCHNDGRPSSPAGATIASKCAIFSSKIGSSQLHPL